VTPSRDWALRLCQRSALCAGEEALVGLDHASRLGRIFLQCLGLTYSGLGPGLIRRTLLVMSAELARLAGRAQFAESCVRS